MQNFHKGDLVYIYDPVHKRGKAKKFSYHYKGPVEIEQKISPLVYKLRMADGTFAIVYTNRPKKAPDQQKVLGKASPVGNQVDKAIRRGKPKDSVQKEQKEVVETEGRDKKVPYHPQVIESEGVVCSDSENNEENLPLDRGDDSEWNPGS
jgi:hypothetical protein